MPSIEKATKLYTLVIKYVSLIHVMYQSIS